MSVFLRRGGVAIIWQEGRFTFLAFVDMAYEFRRPPFYATWRQFQVEHSLAVPCGNPQALGVAASGTPLRDTAGDDRIDPVPLPSSVSFWADALLQEGAGAEQNSLPLVFEVGALGQ